jgi:NAD(P)H-nitrite reductase large subunit
VAYAGSLSRNVMRVFNLDVLTIGNANPSVDVGYRCLQTGGVARPYYRRLVLKDDILVGAVMINQIEQGGVLRSLIENRIPIRRPPETLMKPGFNFGQLIK